MVITIRSVAYLAASLLFILSLRGLSTQESAGQGNRFGIIGMLVAVVMTALALLLSGDSAAATPDTTVVGVLAGVVPAWQAARVDPAESLRTE